MEIKIQNFICCFEFSGILMSKSGSIYFLIIALIILFTYTLICGSNRFHRNGLIGKLYQMFFSSLFPRLKRLFFYLIPKKFYNNESITRCLGEEGSCRYFIFVFFIIIYSCFAVLYFYEVYPRIHLIYKNVLLHKILSWILLPDTWIVTYIIRRENPGVIHKRNILSYLKIYHFDRVIYFPGLCGFTNLPIVPRSRYDKFSKRRIAYVFL